MVGRSSRTGAGAVAATAAVTALLLATAGCSAPAPRPPPTTGPDATATVGAARTASPPAEPGASGLGESPPSPLSPSVPAISDAPLAFLVVGDERFPGEVGGFTFGPYTQSAPWLPARALETVALEPGADVRIVLDDRAAIEAWSARLATADDVTGDAVAQLASGSGVVAAFAAPAAGDWVLAVSITYAGGLGDGTYFWHVIVGP
ncbi:MAG TPA: hypothetical protein VFO78_10525 [Candidatus Limnocylindrales bacterium]|nr:hypothetical protein [Candidatus Limnocylindrales bacterium]